MKERLSRNIQLVENQTQLLEVGDHKSLRKMANRMQRKLGGRLNIDFSGKAVTLGGRNFIEIQDEIGDTSFISLSSVGVSEFSPKSELNIISGTCLFGVTGLEAFDRLGEVYSLTDPLADLSSVKFESVEEMATVHPSEAESVLRISQALKILFQEKENAGDQFVLYFHLPLPEYLLYLVEHFQSGALSVELALEASEMVIERSKMVEKMFVKRIPEGLPMKVVSPLEAIAPMVIDKDFDVSLEQMLEKLSSGDKLWEGLINNFSPRSFVELNYLSYSYLYHSVQEVSKEEGSELIVVEESKEAIILNQAKKQAAALGRQLRLNALYVAPKVLTVSGRHGKTELFMHDTHEEEILPQLKSVVSAYKAK